MKYYMILISGVLLLESCGAASKDNLNDEASLSFVDAIPVNPLEQIALTSSIQPNEGTMSTLYGNEIANEYAQTHGDAKYPSGTTLYEVTWRQKADSLWFGANIPKEIIKIEVVRFDENSSPAYERYEGRPLRKMSNENINVSKRIDAIRSQRMAVSP